MQKQKVTTAVAKSNQGNETAAKQRVSFVLTSNKLTPIKDITKYLGGTVKFRKDGFLGISEETSGEVTNYRIEFIEGTTAPAVFNIDGRKISSWTAVKAGVPVGIDSSAVVRTSVSHSVSSLLSNAGRIRFNGTDSKESLLPPLGQHQQWGMATNPRAGSLIATCHDNTGVPADVFFNILSKMPVLGNDRSSVYVNADENKEVSLFDSSFISPEYPIIAIGYTEEGKEPIQVFLSEPTHTISKNQIVALTGQQWKSGAFVGLGLEDGEDIKQVVLTLTEKTSQLDRKIMLTDVLPTHLDKVPQYKEFVHKNIANLWDRLQDKDNDNAITVRDWLRLLVNIYMANACGYELTDQVVENKPVLKFGPADENYYITMLYNLGQLSITEKTTEGATKFTIGKSSFFGKLNYQAFLNDFNKEILSQTSKIQNITYITTEMNDSFPSYSIYDKYEYTAGVVSRAYDAPLGYRMDTQGKSPRILFEFPGTKTILFNFGPTELKTQLEEGKTLAGFLMHKALATPRVVAELKDANYKAFYEKWANSAEAWTREVLGIAKMESFITFENPKDEDIVLVRGRKVTEKPVHVVHQYKVKNLKF
jgi:hypothetical protein